MYTIIDYLKYYKNVLIEDIQINIMDNLIFSILVYLPIETFSGSMNLDEFYNYCLKYKSNEFVGNMTPISYEVLDLVHKSNRYKGLKISNFTKIRDNNTQFGAATFRIKDYTVISYKGTDGSLIGWVENIRIAYEYPSYTQKLAINYLKNNIKSKDKNIYVSGHSKGGNLAMVSAMEYQKRIKKIYNFDGPGFRKKEFESIKYKKIENKLENIIPSNSVIGTLLNNKNYKVVKSNKLAFEQHYPNSWNIFGECFIPSIQSNISKQLHDSTTIGIDELDEDKIKETFEIIFSKLGKKYSSDFKFNLNDIKNVYINMKSIDPEIKNYIDTIIDSMINALHK